MAISQLGQTAKSLLPTKGSEDDEKQLVREYGKQNPSIYQEAHVVISGKVSKSNKWVILETESYMVLIPVGNSAIQELYNSILPALNNKKGNSLVCCPDKKNKFGATIGVDDETQHWYSFDETALTFELSEEEPAKQAGKQKKLSLEMFISTNNETHSSVTTNTPKEILNSTTATPTVTSSRTRTTKKLSQEA